MKNCEHRKTIAEYDGVTCKDCGSFLTDSAWGIARNRWFKSRGEAEFYRSHGRIPDDDGNVRMLMDENKRLREALEPFAMLSIQRHVIVEEGRSRVYVWAQDCHKAAKVWKGVE